MKSISEALANLKQTDSYRIRLALEFLAETDVNPKHTRDVYEACVPLLKHPVSGVLSANSLLNWASPELLPLLAPLLEDPQYGGITPLLPILGKLSDQDTAVDLLGKLLVTRVPDEEVVRVLKKAGKKAQPHLLGVLNASQLRVRQEAEKALLALGVEEKELRAQTVKDLTSPNESVRTEAIKRLSKYKPDPDREEERTSAARILMTKLDTTRDGILVAEAMRAGWVTKEQIPELLKILENGGYEAPRTIEILMNIKDPRSFEPIAVFFVKQPRSELVVRKAFLSFGSPAEDTVIQLVGNPNVTIHRSALQILAEIGTTKSANALTKASPVLLKRDPSSRIQLTTTIAKIKEREKK
jgi:HEAT repeat protein